MAIDSASKLRTALERRREKSATTGLQRIPFMLDTDLADKVEELAGMYNKIQDHIARLEEQAADEGLEEGYAERVDVRASGHDLSDTGRALDEARAELSRIHGVLTDAVAEAKSNQVTLVFRRAESEEYEEILAAAGGSTVDTDESLKSASRFQTMLVERCFLRLEIDGEDSGTATWAEFSKDAQLSFGEADPIRALVYANNRRGGNNVRF